MLAERIEWEFFGVGPDWPSSWHCVDAQDPWPILAGCQRLVSAAGTSVWEAAVVGIPTVLLKVANNQRLVAKWAQENGGAVVDAQSARDADALCTEILHVLDNTRALPPLESGAGAVVRRILNLAGSRSLSRSDL
jgi:spore coat polysaccharide biosynthesis predicted glycosyltransferase SpsG